MIVKRDNSIEEKNLFSDPNVGFDLDFVVDKMNKLPDTAMAKMKSSGKRPIELIEDYLNSKIRNDPLIVKRLLRIYLSTYTDEPINAGLLAPSAEGKTYATVEAAEIFPKEDVIAIGRMSPTALINTHGILIDQEGNPIQPKLDQLRLDLFNAETDNEKKLIYEIKEHMKEILNTARTQVDLTHKILLFLDNPKPETYEVLKPIMSHDKKEIIYKTTKSDGSLSVKETVIKGWPVFVFCSAKNEAKNEVWAEIATREVILSPNTDVSKYHAANKLTSQKMGIPSILESNNNEKEIIKFYVEQLKSVLLNICKDGNPVINPFNQHMADLFPHNEGVTMRHFKRLLSFVNIETLVNAHSNMRIEYQINNTKKEKKTFVIASLKMIHDAIKTLGNISTVAPEKIKFYHEIFVPLIREKSTFQISLNDTDEEASQQKLIASPEVVTVTKEEVAEKFTKVFHKTITPKAIQEYYLKHLSDEGILDYKENPDNKKQYLYFLSSVLSTHNLENIVRQLNDKHISHFAYIWSCLVKPFQLSCKMGKMLRVYDAQNTRINYNQFNDKISLLNNYNNINNNNNSGSTTVLHDKQGESK